VEPIDVTEEEVRVELEKLRNIHAELVPKEEGVVERGDFVVVRYEGYHDGLPLEEVRSEAYPLEVGSETLLPEFEAALIGMRKDEEKEIEIDFPPDYPDRAYASKRIRFHLRVKEIKQRRLPHIGDDFAKDLGFDDLSALMDGIRERIRGQKGKQRRAYVERAIIERLLEKNEIPVPPSYLSWRLERSLERMRAELKKGGYTRAEEEVLESVERDKVKKDLERRIKEEILIVNIARMESIVVTDEEVEDRLRRIASEMKKAYEEVRALYSSKGLLVPLKADMLEEKVLNFLVDSAIIKERNP
jgi:trigger factor